MRTTNSGGHMATQPWSVLDEAANDPRPAVTQRDGGLIPADVRPAYRPVGQRRRDLSAQLRAIGDQGYALAEKAMKVAEEEAERKWSA